MHRTAKSNAVTFLPSNTRLAGDCSTGSRRATSPPPGRDTVASRSGVPAASDFLLLPLFLFFGASLMPPVARSSSRIPVFLIALIGSACVLCPCFRSSASLTSGECSLSTSGTAADRSSPSSLSKAWNLLRTTVRCVTLGLATCTSGSSSSKNTPKASLHPWPSLSPGCCWKKSSILYIPPLPLYPPCSYPFPPFPIPFQPPPPPHPPLLL